MWLQCLDSFRHQTAHQRMVRFVILLNVLVSLQTSTFGRPKSAAVATAWAEIDWTIPPSTRRNLPSPARAKRIAAELPTAPTPTITTKDFWTFSCPAPRNEELRESCSATKVLSSSSHTVLPDDTNLGLSNICLASWPVKTASAWVTSADCCVLGSCSGRFKQCLAKAKDLATRSLNKGSVSESRWFSASVQVAKIRFSAVAACSSSHFVKVNRIPVAAKASSSGFKALRPSQTSWTIKLASAGVTSSKKLRPPDLFNSFLLKLSSSLSTRFLRGAGVGCGQNSSPPLSKRFNTCAAMAIPAAAGCVPRTGMTRRRKFATLPKSSGLFLCSSLNGRRALWTFWEL